MYRRLEIVINMTAKVRVCGQIHGVFNKFGSMVHSSITKAYVACSSLKPCHMVYHLRLTTSLYLISISKPNSNKIYQFELYCEVHLVENFSVPVGVHLHCQKLFVWQRETSVSSGVHRKMDVGCRMIKTLFGRWNQNFFYQRKEALKRDSIK